MKEYKLDKLNNGYICQDCMKEYKLDKLNNGYRNYIDNETEEEKIIRCNSKSISSKNMWNSMTNEKRVEHSKATKEGQHNMTKEAIREWNKNKSISIKNYYDKLSYESHIERDRKIALNYNYNHPYIPIENINNKCELKFIKLLLDNNINYFYQWYNIHEHDQFRKLFNYNSTNDKIYTSPFHKWDFCIRLNNKFIFIDIDGSIHDESQNDYIVTNIYGKQISMTDIESFYDNKRKYQTDGNNAYIVKCYNNELDYTNEVMNVNTDEILNVKELLNLLISLNF